MMRSSQPSTISTIRRTIVVPFFVVLFHIEPYSAFSQIYPEVAFYAEAGAVLAREMTFEEELKATDTSMPSNSLTIQSFSADVQGASSTAESNQKIVETTANSSYQGDNLLSSGAARASFFDPLDVKSVLFPGDPGDDLAVMGTIRYSRSGSSNPFDGEVRWDAGNWDRETGAILSIYEGSGPDPTVRRFTGEEEIIIPLSGSTAQIGLYLESNAKSSAGPSSQSGEVKTSIELVTAGFLSQLFGGDSLKFGRWSGVASAPEFTEDMTIVGTSARIVGKSGRVYKRGDTNSLFFGNILGALGAIGEGVWNSRGAGTATTQQESSSSVTQLEAGSEVVLYQLVDTPLTPMDFRYDVALVPNDEMSNLGTLSVFLNSTLIDQLDRSDVELGLFFERSVYLDDPALLGLTGAEFAFHWDGPTGERVWLDNPFLAATVPEPATWALALVAVVWVCRLRKMSA